MAWDTVLVNMLRIIIDDFDEGSPTYSDDRLQQILVVAAQYVNQEISFDTSYTVNINSPNISPDPTSSSSRDDAFANFVVLKAACIINQSALRAAAISSGVKAKCGPVEIQTAANSSAGYELLIREGPCKTYNTLKWEYEVGNANGIHAIFSPFVSNSFDPRNLYTADHRDRGYFS